MRASRIVCALLLVAALGLTGCGGGSSSSTSDPASSQGSGSSAEGKALVDEKCSMCHSVDRITTKTADRAGWEETIARMEGHGLQITDAEKAAVLDYLVNKDASQ